MYLCSILSKSPVSVLSQFHNLRKGKRIFKHFGNKEMLYRWAVTDGRPAETPEHLAALGR